MTPESVVQGEKDLTRLGEKLEKGFLADNIVRCLTLAELGYPFSKTKGVLKDGSKFLSQIIRESRRGFIYPESDIIDALLRTKTEEEGALAIDLELEEEVLPMLELYKSTLDSLRKGRKVDVDQIKTTRWFFTHFSEIQLTGSLQPLDLSQKKF